MWIIFFPLEWIVEGVFLGGSSTAFVFSHRKQSNVKERFFFIIIKENT